MPSHFHLLLSPDGGNGSKFMKRLKETYTAYYNAKYAKVGHVWQGRFWSSHIKTEAYLMACGNYIGMNPVRRDLAKEPGQWLYSSYRYYAEGRLDPIISPNPLYPDLGKTSKARMTAYCDQLAKTRMN
jgi:putative transposase